MFTVVVRRDPDKGYYYTVHDRKGHLVAVSACWPSKAACGQYLRTAVPSRTRIEDDTL